MLYAAVNLRMLTVTVRRAALHYHPQAVPNITLNGRQFKVIVTDYHYGSSGFVPWSTALIFFASHICTHRVSVPQSLVDGSSTFCLHSLLMKSTLSPKQSLH